jgi:hypothetical protein
MPKEKLKRDLYEKCWGCDGTRKLTKPVHIDETRTRHRNAQPGEECPLCEDGYCKIGVSVGQMERLVEKAQRVPEMLAALEGVVRVADRATVEFDAARAAIAKARGEPCPPT